MVLSRYFVFGGNLVRVLDGTVSNGSDCKIRRDWQYVVLVRLLEWERFHRLDARHPRRDEVIQVVCRQDSTHCVRTAIPLTSTNSSDEIHSLSRMCQVAGGSKSVMSSTCILVSCLVLIILSPIVRTLQSLLSPFPLFPRHPKTSLACHAVGNSKRNTKERTIEKVMFPRKASDLTDPSRCVTRSDHFRNVLALPLFSLAFVLLSLLRFVHFLQFSC